MKFLEQNLAFLFIFISFGSFAQELALQQCTSYEKTGAKKSFLDVKVGKNWLWNSSTQKTSNSGMLPPGSFLAVMNLLLW